MLKNKKTILYIMLFIILLGGLAHCVQKTRHQFFAPPIIIPDIMYAQKQNFYFITVNNKKHYISVSVSIQEMENLYAISSHDEFIPITKQQVLIENNNGEKFGPFLIQENEYISFNTIQKRTLFLTDNREQALALCRNVFFYGSDGTDFTLQIDPTTICVKRCPDVNNFYFCSYREKPVYFWEFWNNAFEYE